MEPLRMEKCCCHNGCSLRKCVLFQSVLLLSTDILSLILLTLPYHTLRFEIESRRAFLVLFLVIMFKVNLQVGVFVGTLKRMKYLMIPYLVLMGTVIVTLYFVSVVCIFIFYETGLIGLGIAAISSYFWLTINSYYMLLAERDSFGGFSMSETTL